MRNNTWNKIWYKIKKIMLPLLLSIVILVLIFLIAALVWMIISGEQHFFLVLQKILKNAGAYSTLLTAFIVTIFFNGYQDIKFDQKVLEEKIKDIGQFYFYFPNFNPKEGVGAIHLINEEIDYSYISNPPYFVISFLTDKKDGTYLKNLMAFSNGYFKKNEKEILKDYYSFCKKIEYTSKTFIKAISLSDDFANKCKDNYCIFTAPENFTIENDYIWFTAITNQGYLLIIQAKADIVNNTLVIKETCPYFKHENSKIELLN